MNQGSISSLGIYIDEDKQKKLLKQKSFNSLKNSIDLELTLSIIIKKV
jgi:hypothetical protein